MIRHEMIELLGWRYQDMTEEQQDVLSRVENIVEVAVLRERYKTICAAELSRLHAELERCKQVCAATAEGWRVERDALLKTMKWLDNWMGAKPMTECSEKVRAAIKAVEGEKT